MYRRCPDCGAVLDSGEKCDCRKNPLPSIPAKRRKPSARPKAPPPELVYDSATGTLKAIIHVRK